MPSRTVQHPTRRSPPRWNPRQEEIADPEPENDHGISMRPDHPPSRPEEQLTRMGHLDRRFKGQRDLPEPPEHDYKPARTGGVIDEIHVTLSGKPDRRFKENRALNNDEIIDAHISALQSRRDSRH